MSGENAAVRNFTINHSACIHRLPGCRTSVCVRDCSVDLITICIPAQFPYPKILKRRDLPAAFRLRLLSDGRVAEVIVDRSSGYAGLDENAAKGSINQESPVPDRAISIRKP